MTDLGTVSKNLDIPFDKSSAPGYTVGTLGIPFTATKNLVKDFEKVLAPVYNVAGTIDNSYKPPVPYFFPRGDRDITDRN